MEVKQMALANMTQAQTDEYNRNHCKEIAETIEAYVNGDVRRCPECGAEHERDWDDVGDRFKCPECGAVASTDDWEMLSIYDYLDDILDITFTVDSRKNYKSASICIAWGGPSIYIETADSYIRLYWWGDRAEYPLSYSASDAIDEWAEDYYNCL
jgi:rubredoxin